MMRAFLVCDFCGKGILANVTSVMINVNGEGEVVFPITIEVPDMHIVRMGKDTEVQIMCRDCSEQERAERKQANREILKKAGM